MNAPAIPPPNQAQRALSSASASLDTLVLLSKMARDSRVNALLAQRTLSVANLVTLTNANAALPIQGLRALVLLLRPNVAATMASVGKQVTAPQSTRAKALTLIATAMHSVFTLGLAHTNVCASKDGLVMAKLAQRFVCVIQTMVAVLTKLNAFLRFVDKKF